MTSPRPATTMLLTALALLAFAANSVLCRLALGAHTIDPAAFTLIRLASGAVLLALLHVRRFPSLRLTSQVWQPVLLFTYAVAFSFAYTSLSAGTGALILFGGVQLTMVLLALRSGERFKPLEGLGLVLAIAGLVYLVLPGVHAPSPVGAALMASAGASWGVYSLLGRGSKDPGGDTTRNFVLAAPLAVVVAAIAYRSLHITPHGALLAAASGALTSGLGYVVWFAALRGLTALRAATVQLAVPAIAATGGVIFLGEHVSPRLLVAGALILGGIGLAIVQRVRPR